MQDEDEDEEHGEDEDEDKGVHPQTHLGHEAHATHLFSLPAPKASKPHSSHPGKSARHNTPKTFARSALSSENRELPNPSRPVNAHVEDVAV